MTMHSQLFVDRIHVLHITVIIFAQFKLLAAHRLKQPCMLDRPVQAAAGSMYKKKVSLG